MTKKEFLDNINRNKELLEKLRTKKKNLELQIKNLEVRIENQENAISSFKEDSEDKETK